MQTAGHHHWISLACRHAFARCHGPASFGSLLLALVACTGGPGFMQQSGSPAAINLREAAIMAPVTVEADGAVTAALVPDPTRTQVVQAATSSDIAGAVLTIPPGQLAVATELTIEAATSIESASLELGIDAVEQSGAAVAIAISDDAATVPGTLAIPLPSIAGLTDTGEVLQNLVVLYHRQLTAAQGGEIAMGVIPRDRLRIEGSLVQFDAELRGRIVFQAVVTRTLVVAAVEKPVERPIVTKREATLAAPGAFEIVGPGTLVGSSSADIVWTYAAGAESYEVVVARDSACSAVETSGINIAVNSFKAEGLSDGVFYACVHAVNAAGKTPASNQSYVVRIAASPLQVKVEAKRLSALRYELRALVQGPEPIKILWRQVGTQGSSAFSSPTQVVTTVQASAAIEYRWQVIVKDGAGREASADFAADLREKPMNLFVWHGSKPESYAVVDPGIAIAGHRTYLPSYFEDRSWADAAALYNLKDDGNGLVLESETQAAAIAEEWIAPLGAVQTFNNNLTPGKVGGGLTTHASGGELVVPNDMGLAAGAAGKTISLWFKLATGSGTPCSLTSSVQYLLSVWSAGRVVWAIKVAKSSGTTQLVVSDPMASQSVTFNRQFCDGAWHHLAFVQSGSMSTAVGYIDGMKWTPIVSGASPTSPASGGPLTAFGGGIQSVTISGSTQTANVSDRLVGSLDEFAVVNRLLNEEEIFTLYEQQLMAKSGVVLSRAIPWPGSVGAWSQVGFAATQPLNKPLPMAPETTDPGFEGGAIDTKDLVVVQEFEDTCPLANACSNWGPIGLRSLRVLSNVPVTPSDPQQPIVQEPFSLTFWLRANSSSTLIMQKMLSSSGFEVSLSSGRLRFMLRRSSLSTGMAVVTGMRSVFDGQWHHVAIVSTPRPPVNGMWPNDIKIYIDGALDVAATPSLADVNGGSYTPDTQPITLTSSGHLLDQVAVFKRPLSPSEVNALFERGAKRVIAHVRHCADETCNQSSFLDGSNQAICKGVHNPQWVCGLQALSSPIAQYRLFMGSLVANITPVVRRVRLGPGRFPTDAPSVTTTKGPVYRALKGFRASLDGTVLFQISPNGKTWYSVINGAWTQVTDNPAQASTLAAIQSVATSFHQVAGEGQVQVRAYLMSDGLQSAEIRDIAIDFIPP